MTAPRNNFTDEISKEIISDQLQLGRKVSALQHEVQTGFRAWHTLPTTKTEATSTMIQGVIRWKESKADIAKSDSGTHQIRVAVKDVVEAGDREGIVSIGSRGELTGDLIVEPRVGIFAGSLLGVVGEVEAEPTQHHITPLTKFSGGVEILPSKPVSLHDKVETGDDGSVRGAHGGHGGGIISGGHP